MTGPYHTICSLYEVLKNHENLKQSVFINKINFLKNLINILFIPITSNQTFAHILKKKS